MSNLFQIESDLINIFEQIEENEGELTPELENALNITETEFKNKLNSYRLAINEWNSDIDKCKTEAKRLTAIAKVRENRIARLKSAMTNAVEMFGNSGKNNKYIELDDCRISTKNTKAVEFDEKRIYYLQKAFVEIINELETNNILYTGHDVDLEGMLNSINQIVKTYYYGQDEEFIPFTLNDLLNTKFEIIAIYSIADLLRWQSDLTRYIANESENYEMKHATSKTEIKNIIETVEDITIAKLNNNKSILIK